MLALKGNQGTLRSDVQEFFSEQVARGFADAHVSQPKPPGRFAQHNDADVRRQAAGIAGGCERFRFHGRQAGKKWCNVYDDEWLLR